MKNKFRERFFNRMAMRKYRHGAEFRQTYVDCGGMCIKCGSLEHLEYHEPFGEAKNGWLMLQKRILLCIQCHNAEHPEFNSRMEHEFMHDSMLSEDFDIEVWLYGGWDKWIKHFGLVDRFGCLYLTYQEMHEGELTV